MNKEELIASGKLELYISGSLAAEELAEVENAISEYPEIKSEVEKIEASLITLAEAVAPPLSALVWTYILNSIKNVRQLSDNKQRTNWSAITGWAAAILAITGIFWMLNQNNTLENRVEVTTTENEELKENLLNTETELAEANNILEIIRSKDYNTINLPGNIPVAPEAFARVYFNKNENLAYIDANGLPEAPEGKVYQVWSLILDPLTPRSMGLLDDMAKVEDGIYKFENIPDPEAFGITLEPAGGSETPTLTQLYTLGAVSP
jgi:anti-sigma-K factor RskA